MVSAPAGSTLVDSMLEDMSSPLSPSAGNPQVERCLRSSTLHLQENRDTNDFVQQQGGKECWSPRPASARRCRRDPGIQVNTHLSRLSSMVSSPRLSASVPVLQPTLGGGAPCRRPSHHRGPERFYYDRSSYTGCARYGGPSIDGKENGPAVLRPNLNRSAGRPTIHASGSATVQQPTVVVSQQQLCGPPAGAASVRRRAALPR